MAQKILCDLSPTYHSPSHYHPATWLSFRSTKFILVSRPLHLQFPLPGILSLESFTWLAPSCHSGHSSTSPPHYHPPELFNLNYTLHASCHILCHCHLTLPCLLICVIIYCLPYSTMSSIRTFSLLLPMA